MRLLWKVSPPFFWVAVWLVGSFQPCLAAPCCAYILICSWWDPAARVDVCRYLCEALTAITELNEVLLVPPCML